MNVAVFPKSGVQSWTSSTVAIAVVAELAWFGVDGVDGVDGVIGVIGGEGEIGDWLFDVEVVGLVASVALGVEGIGAFDAPLLGPN